MSGKKPTSDVIEFSILVGHHFPQEYRDMISVNAAEALKAFAQKAADYPPDGFKFLGIKGQFSDITRKFFKLKEALWDDIELNGEQPDEIMEDLIGHLLIALHLWDTR